MTKITSFLSKPFQNIDKSSVHEEKCYLLFLRATFFRDRVGGGTWRKKRQSHILPRDTLWSVNKRGEFFCSNLFIFCRKFAKTVKNARCLKVAEMWATSMATRTLLHKNAKGRKPFSNTNICLGGINKLFESKNRIINLTLNSRQVFENRQYFIVYKSYFGAVFQFCYAV